MTDPSFEEELKEIDTGEEVVYPASPAPDFRKKKKRGGAWRVPALLIAAVLLCVASAAAGYTAGHKGAFDSGYDAGFETGYAEGNDLGYNDGLEAGKEDGYGLGYEEGTAAAKNDGYYAAPLAEPGTGAAVGGEIVYRTASGGSYHRADCSYIRDRENVTALTVNEAEDEGLTPCGFCME